MLVSLWIDHEKNSRDKHWVQPDMKKRLKKSINWIETNNEAGVLRYFMHFRATLNHRYTLSIGLDLFNGVCQSVSGSPEPVSRVNITRDIYIKAKKDRTVNS